MNRCPLRKEQHKLSKGMKDSKNRDKQHKKVAKLHEKVTNQRKDFLHKQSRQIANAYDEVVIEGLNMRGMAQGLKLAKSTQNLDRIRNEEVGTSVRTVSNIVEM